MADLGGDDISTWLALVHGIGLAAVAPFAGALSDLIGRRYLGVFGASLVMAGMFIVGFADTMQMAIIGMAVAGAGGGFSGVVGISGILELIPVKSRGKYIGSVFMAFFPMAPASAYCSSSRLNC